MAILRVNAFVLKDSDPFASVQVNGVAAFFLTDDTVLIAHHASHVPYSKFCLDVGTFNVEDFAISSHGDIDLPFVCEHTTTDGSSSVSVALLLFCLSFR